MILNPVYDEVILAGWSVDAADVEICSSGATSVATVMLHYYRV